MIESEEQYLKKKKDLERLRSTLEELKNNPASDLDVRFHELYVEATKREMSEAETQIAEYEARHKVAES